MQQDHLDSRSRNYFHATYYLEGLALQHPGQHFASCATSTAPLRQSCPNSQSVAAKIDQLQTHRIIVYIYHM